MDSPGVSPTRRREILDALRRGTVPQNGLDVLAVGLDRLKPAINEELDGVSEGASSFKAVRGEYGAGKTFFGRWLAENARGRGFASSEVQISETETPLYRHETIYRRVVERLSTVERSGGALRDVVDAWFFALEQDALAEGTIPAGNDAALLGRTDELVEQRLARVGARAPAFSAALRGYRRAQAEGRRADADGLLAWLGGQPHVAAAVKRGAGVKGDVDHDAALGFLLGLLLVLRDSGHPGLVVVLDEVETLQRMRSDVRERSLNALRQLIDEIDGGALPGLHLVVTGTSAFFDGPQGAQQLPPLAQRLATDFATDARFDNPRAVQIRLSGFDLDLLTEVGRKVRDLYADGATSPERVLELVDDAYVLDLASAVTGQLGGRVGVAPRVFLKKLVADILDRVDQFPEFRPNEHYALTVDAGELTPAERAARGAVDPDDVDLTP
jgi:hypothetical protein